MRGEARTFDPDGAGAVQMHARRRHAHNPFPFLPPPPPPPAHCASHPSGVLPSTMRARGAPYSGEKFQDRWHFDERAERARRSRPKTCARWERSLVRSN